MTCIKEYKKLFPSLSNARITVGSLEGQRLIVEGVKRIKGELYVVACKPGTTRTDNYLVATVMAEHLCTAEELARWDALVVERAAAAAKANAEWMAKMAQDAEGERANAAYEADRWARALPQFDEWHVTESYARCTAQIVGAPRRKAPRHEGDEPREYQQEYRVEMYINRKTERFGNERAVTYESEVNWSAIGSVSTELAMAYANLIREAAIEMRGTKSDVVERMEAKAAEAEAKYAQQ